MQEDIVISGIGGFFPKCRNIEEFGTLLLEGGDVVGSRWKAGLHGVTNKIGKTPDSDRFDTSFFSINPKQSHFMDPMTRMTLERTFEALIDAGINPAEVRGKRIACLIGSSISSHDYLATEDSMKGFGVTGGARSMMANRISYWLNINGPSNASDNTHLNGIEMLSQGYSMIKSGYCEAAIIGAANLCTSAQLNWQFNELQVLSPDGTTKPFDADANGYLRSDAVVIFYLQRASEAKRIYATVVNAKTEYDGNRPEHLLIPGYDHFKNFLQNFYRESGVDPNEIKYLETHGTALKKIDEIELNVIEEVFCKNRKEPLLIGSVKSEVGHTEAASSIVSLAKALITMEKHCIPPNRNFSNPNPAIPGLTNGNLKVVTENTEWNGGYIAVNGFGLAGSVGHALLKSNTKEKDTVKYRSDIPLMTLLSSRTADGIENVVTKISSQTTTDHEFLNLINEVFSTKIFGHLHRGYVLFDSDVKFETLPFTGRKRPIWFAYSGMGSQWPTMAKSLMKIPIFASAVFKLHEILMTKGVDLLSIITEDDPQIFDNILYSFVGIAAVQVGLTDLLYSLGIKPDGMIGHSVGELGCSYADGCLTAEQVILAAYSRGKATLDANLEKGMMAAVGLGYKQIEKKLPLGIEVACHNGPESCTLSGPANLMEKFVNQLKKKGIFARLVNVSNVAYHSTYIEPAAPYLLRYLEKVITNPKPRSSKWISTSIPESEWNTDLAKLCSAEYHTHNLLNSVLFEEGIKHIPTDAIIIEIAPHGLLQSILKRSLNENCTNVSLTQKGNQNGLNVLLSALGKLYLNGLDINISALYPPVKYPVSRGTKSLAPLVDWEHGEEYFSVLAIETAHVKGFKEIVITLSDSKFKNFLGHKYENEIIIPPAGYLKLITDLMSDITISTKFIFEDLHFRNVVRVPLRGSAKIEIMLQMASFHFEVYHCSELIVSGRAIIPETTTRLFAEPPEIVPNSNRFVLETDDFYGELEHRGYNLSGTYKSLKELSIDEDGSVAKVEWNGDWPSFATSMMQILLFHCGERKQELLYTSYIQRIVLCFDKFPKNQDPCDLNISYHYNVGIITSNAVEISLMETKPVPIPEKMIPVDMSYFAPFINNDVKNLEDGLSVLAQIIVENTENEPDEIFSFCDTDDVKTVGDCLENLFAKYSKLQVQRNTIQNIENTETDLSPLLIVLNENHLTKIPKKLIKDLTFVLIKMVSQNSKIDKLFVKVAEFSYDKQTYCLIKKLNEIKPLIVKMRGDSMSCSDLKKGTLPWISELRSAMENINNNNNNNSSSSRQRVFLLSNKIPMEGIPKFVKELESLPYLQSVKCVFILETNILDFTKISENCDCVFQKDLKVSVLQDGIWGCYVRRSLDVYNSRKVSPEFNFRTIANCKVKYAGINSKDPFGDSTDIACVDYSGISSSGNRVMGLAKVDEENSGFVTDEDYVWSIPESWSLESAATVPYAYAVAYYILNELTTVQPEKTVLIHQAYSPIGQAITAVSLAYNCNVFVTVATAEEKDLLKRSYPKICIENIFVLEDDSFEIKLLYITKGAGAHMVINTLTGSSLHASLRCLGFDGRFVNLGDSEPLKRTVFGMNLFMKNASVFGVLADSILTERSDVKRSIYKYVSNGIETGVVVPLSKTILDSEGIFSNSRCIQNDGKKIIVPINKTENISTATKRYRFDKKSSYLIYGGSSDIWINITEWMVYNGARKIVIAPEVKENRLHINRRLAVLQHYYDCAIMFASNKGGTASGSSELLNEVDVLGPVRAIFVLPTNPKRAQYLEEAAAKIAPKALFVALKSTIAGICNYRNSSYKSAYSIDWDSDSRFQDVLTVLNYALVGTIHDELMVKVSEDALHVEHDYDWTMLLPETEEDLIELAESLPSALELIQLPSLCPRQAREIPPIFIMPGTEGSNSKYIKQLSRNLMYPVYVINLPTITSQTVKDLAQECVKQMKTVYPSGPYNIIGISYGGQIAIEVALQLEDEGGKTQIYFIDSAPEIVYNTSASLGTGGSAETNLLIQIFNLEPSEAVTLNKCANWEDRLQTATRSCKYDPSELFKMAEAVRAVWSWMSSLTEYVPDKTINGTVHLIRPEGCSKEDNCGLYKICKQSVFIELFGGNHRTMLNEKSLAEFINDRVIITY